MDLNKTESKYFAECIQEIIQSKPFQETKKYCQHGTTSTYRHCLVVSYYSYWLSLRLPMKFDHKSVARGALLHDFYLYDWHIPDKSHRLHGYTHANTAYGNACKHYNINKTEADIIKNHMWPLNIMKVPQSREAMLVCLVDKYCSFAETFHIPLQHFNLIYLMDM